MAHLNFPNGFVWGAATSAYQIEGAHDRDGRGESIWDRFCHEPGKIKNGDTGAVACDHYGRWRDDVRLMRELGLPNYRLSLSWPRILPTGAGRLNTRGLDFYKRLIDALLDSGIEPWVTLYHWDLPQALHEQGGWASPQIADWFGDYALAAGAALGDRVKNWITLNEPQVFGLRGYMFGVYAPGLASPADYWAAAHHIHLAHYRAVDALRATVPDARIGTTLQLPAVHAATESRDDAAAARRFDALMNRWYLDAALRGTYPEDLLSLLRPVGIPALAERIEDELRTAFRPVDFLGLNHYTRARVRHDRRVPLLECGLASGRLDGAQYTSIGFEVYPGGLHEVLARLRDEYGNPPVYITENGASFDDTVDEQGRIDDPQRIEYLRSYLSQTHRAIADGCDVRGYFVWSLMDNFEWSEGYAIRFGLVHIDRTARTRTPKASARWYRHVIEANGVPEEG